MKRLIILLLLILVAVNYQSCKVLKKVHRSKSEVDSTVNIQQQSHVSTLGMSDSQSHRQADWLKIIQSTNLKADKVTITEDEMPTSSLRISFNVDSLALRGDTLHTKALDGTGVDIFKDKKTGEFVADYQRPGKKRTKTEIQGLSLNTKNQLDSGRKSEDQHNKALVKKDTTGAYKVKADVTKKSATVDKDVKKDFGLLKWLGLAAAAVSLLFVFYKLNKAKGWFKIPFVD